MIEVFRQGSVVVLRMAHGKASALDIRMLRDLRDAFTATLSSNARAVVLTGSGNIFSAGVDLVQLQKGGRPYLDQFLPGLSACLMEMFKFERPLVVAVNGHAIAGGMIFACAADHRLMARGLGRIGVPELRVGVPFPIAALEIVRFALPPHRAQEAILFGRNYTPEEALERGIVDELTEPADLLDRAIAVAEDLGSLPPASFARTKRDLRRPVLEAWADHIETHDPETVEAWASSEVQGAVRAYVEKTLRK